MENKIIGNSKGIPFTGFGESLPTAIDSPYFMTSDLLYQLKVHQAELEIQNSELFEIQELLEDARKRYADLYDFAPVTYVTLDRKGFIQNINLAGSELLGMGRGALIGTSLASWVKEEDIQKLLCHLNESFREPGKVKQDLRIVDAHNNLHIVSLESMASKDLFVCRTVIVDNTGRVFAERQRDKQEHQLNIVTDALPVMIAYIDKHKNHRFVNKAYCRWLKEDKENLIGRNFDEFLDVENATNIKNMVERVMSGEQVHFEVKRQEKNEAEKNIEVTYIPDTIDNKNKGFFVLMRDVTDLKIMDAKKNKQLRDSAHIDRLTAMGEMVGEIAHELNQPLTAISLYCESCINKLSDEKIDISNVIDTIERISEQSKRSADVIVELKRFAAKKELSISFENINDVITDITRLISIEAYWHDVQIDLNLDKMMPDIQLDKILIQQVILNLVRNGMEAMDDIYKDDRKLTITTRKEEQEVVVSVADTGAGFSENSKNHIFEAFVSSKPEGMGMGLAICQSIVKAHRGKICAFQNQIEGATFSFTLPIEEDEEPLANLFNDDYFK